MPALLTDAQLMPEQLKSNFVEFMEKIVQLADLLKIDLQQLQADHIAFRVNDEKLAQLARDEWLKETTLLSQAQINGRPIYVLEFDTPLSYENWSIDCLELPFPAINKKHPVEGWEHVEFVVPSRANSAEDYLLDLMSQFPMFASHFTELEQLGVKTKLSSPKGEGERLNNPTVAFKWDNICIKLHPHPLKKIIESESLA
ncbi:VOC family protein [Vibrio marisflavi]|uniref:Protein YecM n=1 Tax=Vibrio marisflavi CECT 7928 TaxID=634439 RepID=A0ABM9A680_9VIBR|nr:VOC family protein [Vibrio marisflavi]CAH0540782.1 Protein YecM [Vibrio marisflavi CECT 7928]